jgi:hypothetical protein
MQLPALKNSTSLSSINGGMSIEEFIRNSTQNLQRAAASLPGGGATGTIFLNFDGNSGIWKLNKEVVTPESLGRILVPQHSIFEIMKEWLNGSVLQKSPPRQLLGVKHDEEMTEAMLPKPLSSHAYKTERDGPSHMFGFIGFLLDDASNITFEHSSGGGKKAVNVLATNATQAVAVFGEMVHLVVGISTSSYEVAKRTIFEPHFPVIGYVTDKRAREVDVIADSDIITRPTASLAKLRREKQEAPAI